MRKPQRVALVANTSWSIYQFRLGVLRSLKDQGYEPIVIAPPDSFSAMLVSEGYTYIPLPMENYSVNPLVELLTLFRLFRLYKKHKPDFIFHYTIKPNVYGSVAASLCGIPSIAITTGLGHMFSFQQWWIRNFTALIYRIAATLSRETWFLNEDDRSEFVDRNIVPLRKTRLLPGEGIDLTHFSRKHFETTSNPVFRFLFVGRLIWDKGIGELMQAMQLFKEKGIPVELHILGFFAPQNPNAIPYEWIKEVQDKGLVQFLGESNDVRPFFAQADCFVLPSYREGIARVLLEACAMETPVITTDTIGCRDVVKDGLNGLLCRVKDADSLYEKMYALYSMPLEQRQAMGVAGRQFVAQHYDQQQITPYYLSALQNERHQ